jgi:cytochrome b6
MKEKSDYQLPSFLLPLGRIFKKGRDWVVARSGLEDFLAETEKKTIPKHALNPVYCLGGVTLVSFLVLALTGFFLAAYYEPSELTAQHSIQVISTEIPFGFYFKSIHSWSANLMVIAVLLHTLRVFITGSYKRPRELTWIGGVLLLVLTFLFVLTGYVLPMDERSEFATASLSGAFGWLRSIPFIGGAFNWASDSVAEALTGSYWMHVTILPIAVILFMLFHFYLIRKHGISGPL